MQKFKPFKRYNFKSNSECSGKNWNKFFFLFTEYLSNRDWVVIANILVMLGNIQANE